MKENIKGIKKKMNNMSMEFFMPMKQVPTITHQEKKVKIVADKKSGKMKPIFYESEELKNARDDITMKLYQFGLAPYGFLHLNQNKNIVVYPKDTPVSLSVKWCFSNGKSEGKKISEGKEHGSYRISKPDTDNLQKLLKDCMTTLGFWYDDAQVVEEHIGKYWSDTPGIWISIEKLNL